MRASRDRQIVSDRPISALERLSAAAAFHNPEQTASDIVSAIMIPKALTTILLILHRFIYEWEADGGEVEHRVKFREAQLRMLLTAGQL